MSELNRKKAPTSLNDYQLEAIAKAIKICLNESTNNAQNIPPKNSADRTAFCNKIQQRLKENSANLFDWNDKKSVFAIKCSITTRIGKALCKGKAKIGEMELSANSPVQQNLIEPTASEKATDSETIKKLQAKVDQLEAKVDQLEAMVIKLLDKNATQSKEFEAFKTKTAQNIDSLNEKVDGNLNWSINHFALRSGFLA